MNCEDMSMRMSAYLDREVPVQEAKEIEEHLKFCSSCKGQLSQFSRLEEFRSLLAPEKVTEEQWHQCWKSIKKETTDLPASSYARTRFARTALYTAVAAAACVLLLAAWYLAIVLTTVPTEAQEASVIITDYDDLHYTLLVEDKDDFVIIKLTPVSPPADGSDGG